MSMLTDKIFIFSIIPFNLMCESFSSERKFQTPWTDLEPLAASLPPSSACPLMLRACDSFNIRDRRMAPFLLTSPLTATHLRVSSFEAGPPTVRSDTQLVLEQQCSHQTNDSQHPSHSFLSPFLCLFSVDGPFFPSCSNSFFL